jgi:hypothetical protein
MNHRTENKRQNEEKLFMRINVWKEIDKKAELRKCVFNSLKPSGKYLYHLIKQSVCLHFVFMCFVLLTVWSAIISLNSVNRLIFATVKCGIFFAVRTGFLNINYTNLGLQRDKSGVALLFCSCCWKILTVYFFKTSLFLLLSSQPLMSTWK